MGNCYSDSASSDLGLIWHDATDDEEEEEETTVAGPEERQAAGASSADDQTQKASKASEKGVDEGSKKVEEEPWPSHLCGLEHWPEGTTTQWQGPQRIKTCQLTDEQQKTMRELLDRIFHPTAIMGKKASCLVFHPDELALVVDAVIPLLESEPMLIEDVPFDVTVVGDLHGQLYDLDRVFRVGARDREPGWECGSYVFLGNYVDRGRQSIEVITALFCIKCLYPDRIFLLRGNHEFYKTNLTDGFADDFGDQYNVEATAKYLYLLFNEAFAWLSVAAIVGNAYFCAHGGISTSAFTRRQLRGVYKPMILSNEDDLVHNIVWSDPAEGMRGSAFNQSRGTSIYFGFDECSKALASMDVVAIFRGHSVMMSGWGNSWNVCFTLFTATDHGRKMNKGAIAYVSATGKIEMKVLEVDERRAEFERKLRAIEYLPDSDDEDKKTRAVPKPVA